MGFSKLKGDAKKSLKGHWSDTLIIIVLYIIIFSIAQRLDVKVFGGNNVTYDILQKPDYFKFEILNNHLEYHVRLFSMIAGLMMLMGLNSYFLKRSRNEEVTWQELFNKYNLILDALLIGIFVAIFVFCWTLLLIIPGIIATIAYSMAYLVKLDNKDLNAIECIKKSKELMKGHKFDYFLLQLSFIGWILLGPFTLFLLYFWLAPYMAKTNCNLYNELVNKR